MLLRKIVAEALGTARLLAAVVVQVEAPVILHKGGLTGCIKGVVGGLRFPAST